MAGRLLSSLCVRVAGVQAPVARERVTLGFVSKGQVDLASPRWKPMQSFLRRLVRLFCGGLSNSCFAPSHLWGGLGRGCYFHVPRRKAARLRPTDAQ